MSDPLVTYIYPAWGLIPTKEQVAKSHSVHVRITFGEDSPSPAKITHNLDFPYGPPLQEPEWKVPLVLVNPSEGGPHAPQHVLQYLDGDSLTIGRAASGEGTAIQYDVWIFGTPRSPWFS